MSELGLAITAVFCGAVMGFAVFLGLLVWLAWGVAAADAVIMRGIESQD